MFGSVFTQLFRLEAVVISRKCFAKTDYDSTVLNKYGQDNRTWRSRYGVATRRLRYSYDGQVT